MGVKVRIKTFDGDIKYVYFEQEDLYDQFEEGCEIANYPKPKIVNDIGDEFVVIDEEKRIQYDDVIDFAEGILAECE